MAEKRKVPSPQDSGIKRALAGDGLEIVDVLPSGLGRGLIYANGRNIIVPEMNDIMQLFSGRSALKPGADEIASMAKFLGLGRGSELNRRIGRLNQL